MATAANTVTERLHQLAERVVKTRQEVSRVERALNNANFELERFGPNAERLQLQPTAARELDRRRQKVEELRTEHRKVCGQRDQAQREYEKLPVVAETVKGIEEIQDAADEAINGGTDLNKILSTQDELRKLGGEYQAFVTARDLVHMQNGLLSVAESLGARAGSWMRTFEYEDRCRKLLGQVL